MKERIKVPLLGGNESLGSCSKLFEALTKWQWKLPSPLIVCVGHENNWEWLKVPSSRAKFFPRKLIQLSIYVVFSKSLFFFFYLVTIGFLSSQMDTLLWKSISLASFLLVAQLWCYDVRKVVYFGILDTSWCHWHVLLSDLTSTHQCKFYYTKLSCLFPFIFIPHYFTWEIIRGAWSTCRKISSHCN